jgi:hypothetical protein
MTIWASRFTQKAPKNKFSVLFVFASGYSLHHLRGFAARWFRYYPSRYAHLWCAPASRANKK